MVDPRRFICAECRPNQIFAISLPHAVLDPARWAAVMQVVQERLVTPVGLRSLAPGSAHYAPRYFGSLRERDAAYHQGDQGAVWAWLIGPWIDAWRKLHPSDKAGAFWVEGLISPPRRLRRRLDRRGVRCQSALCRPRLHCPGLERGRGVAAVAGRRRLKPFVIGTCRRVDVGPSTGPGQDLSRQAMHCAETNVKLELSPREANKTATRWRTPSDRPTHAQRRRGPAPSWRSVGSSPATAFVWEPHRTCTNDRGWDPWRRIHRE